MNFLARNQQRGSVEHRAGKTRTRRGLCVGSFDVDYACNGRRPRGRHPQLPRSEFTFARSLDRVRVAGAPLA